MAWMEAERQALVTTFRETDPGAPTLCAGWNARRRLAQMIRRFAAGPPKRSPMSWLGDSAQLVEYIVHHEDVRRAGSAPAAARELPAEEQQAIWRQLTFLAKLSYRKSPVGVDVALPSAERRTVNKGSDPVVLTGPPVELALHAMGRLGAAEVQISGSPASVVRFRQWVEAL